MRGRGVPSWVKLGSEPEDQHVRPGPAFLPALTDPSPLVEAEKGADASAEGKHKARGLRGVGAKVVRTQHP